ncbi:hypothetical protein IH980_04455 [Patescibacteria group bacterium]|nr:hypothetical protein [Patescibacteria group bacterium]
MPKRSELLRLLTAGSLVAAGCAPEAKTPEEPQPVGPEATVSTPSPTPTSEPTQIPTLTPTLTRTPTETMTPTETPEPLPTTCLDAEVNGQVVAEYLENTEHSTFLEAMDAWRNSDDFKRNQYNLVSRAGFTNGPSWYMSHNMKILGGYRFSLAEQSGFRDGDFAYCLLGASPHMVDDLVPIVIGVQRNGQWSQANYFFDDSLVGVPPRAILETPEQADAWIEKMRGEVIHPLIVLRFDKPNWERDPLWHVGYDSVLPLLRNSNGYIMRYTNNPSELGSPLTFPDGTPAGEQASLLTVIRELNREPGTDIGLFAFQITIKK